jgi:hypothetical protein
VSGADQALRDRLLDTQEARFVFNVCICLQHVLGELNFGIFLMVPMSHHNAAPPIFTSSNSLSSRDLVGASGFEPEASCAQGRRATQNNPPVFNNAAETKQLTSDRSMWLAVRECPQMFAGWAQNLAHFSRLKQINAVDTSVL